jgi:Fe-S cluster assembly protein SufB
MELSTYFRINQAGTGQFERTLLIADEGSYGALKVVLHQS